MYVAGGHSLFIRQDIRLDLPYAAAPPTCILPSSWTLWARRQDLSQLALLHEAAILHALQVTECERLCTSVEWDFHRLPITGQSIIDLSASLSELVDALCPSAHPVLAVWVGGGAFRLKFLEEAAPPQTSHKLSCPSSVPLSTHL